MSYSKDFNSYPSEFADLIERGAVEGMSLNLGNHENAKRLMGRLYAYKGAIKRAALAKDGTEEHRELHRLAQKSQFRVEGSILVIRPLDQDPDALLIRAALEQPNGPSPASREDGQILVPINPSHLPPWLAELAIKRADSAGS